MSPISRKVLIFCLLCQASNSASWLSAQERPSVTDWENAYQDAEATGSHVLGLWKFDANDGLDASGRQPQGALQHGRLTSKGKFGGALESFVGFPKADRSHGFVVPHSPRLNLPAAFTIELWIRPKAEFAQSEWAVLVDKKYAGHDDYQLRFSVADSAQQRRLVLSLGFGTGSHDFLSDAGHFAADEWVHVAATYDGKGRARFFRNGEAFGGSDAPGRGAISAGMLPLSIGDRLGSNYPGFPGFVDEVRLTSGIREFGRVRLIAHWPRRAFIRFEEPAKWTAEIVNLRREPIADATLAISVGELPPIEMALPEIAPGKSHTVEQIFNTTLRPDQYSVTIAATVDGKKVVDTSEVTLVSRPLPQRMPVVMWGIGGTDGVVAELPRLKQLGFTHCLGGEVDQARIAAAKEPTLTIDPRQMPATIEMLDLALANDFRILASTSPAYFDPFFPDYFQVDREGKSYPRKALTPNAPPVMQAYERAGESIAKTFAAHPAFEGVLANSEIRDESEVSFTEWDLAAYRKAFGDDAEFPEWVRSKYQPSYGTLKDFPADRVVSDNHPQLEFARWWWSIGDGWNAAHSAVHRGMHRGSNRDDLWSFNDPVVRCPPLWGSGGDVDVLSQWTYTDPDPLRMSLPVDELFAMAGGREPPARVMKMTQLFWYRSTTAPSESSPRAGTNPATWADKDDSTSFISIHPMHLREAFWTKIARPIEGIMYHGWSSLVPTDGSHAYKYTHPELQHELTRLTHDIVEPLGPTLRQVPAVKSDIAFLESFTTFAFTSKSTWGYAGGWQADAYFALQHARLQPEVIYEQHILRDGLDAYKILVMTDCEVLPQSVVDQVLAFQQRGGLVVGDEHLCPAITADIKLTSFQRTKDAKADKAQLLSLAEEIRRKLDGKYRRVVDTTSPEIVPHRRRDGSADYIFLVNDAREAGDYVGQYGRVEELGVPTSGEVRIQSDAAAIYDLVAHQSVKFQRDGTELVVPVTLGPCDGSVWMTTPAPIERVRIEGQASVTRGQPWQGRIAILDESGTPIDAVIPLHVRIFDADGRLAERSGYYGAAGGTLDLTLDIATNDRLGVWQIQVREFASNKTVSLFLRVDAQEIAASD